jgi:pyruvate ferredoxin oxidoreductase beta subunit
MRATNGRMIAANATGCLEVFSTPYPETSWRIPWIHSLFANAPAVSSGIAAALRAKGRDDVRVVGQGGDGGTVDIGFACLSGMFERGDDVLYICYDNEAYMNTGVQRSFGLPSRVSMGALGRSRRRSPRSSVLPTTCVCGTRASAARPRG